MMDRKRLEFCTMVFLAEMRRRYAVLHPAAETNPVKNLIDYPADQRSALMASVEKAINCAGPEQERHYQAWLAQQMAEQQPN